jgi:hypothetical protein
MMQKLTLEDTWDLLEYEKIRDEFRGRIIALKKKRRVPVGDFITLVFENRDTALFQIQEMIRIERLVRDAQIEHELEVYNPLIPDTDELSATLFIEAQDRPTLRALLSQLIGLDGHVGLTIGDEFTIPAYFEPDRSREGQISPMQYLRFPFTAEERAAFCNGHGPVAIAIDHPSYQAVAALPGDTRASLVKDLE